MNILWGVRFAVNILVAEIFCGLHCLGFEGSCCISLTVIVTFCAISFHPLSVGSSRVSDCSNSKWCELKCDIRFCELRIFVFFALRNDRHDLTFKWARRMNGEKKGFWNIFTFCDLSFFSRGFLNK